MTPSLVLSGLALPKLQVSGNRAWLASPAQLVEIEHLKRRVKERRDAIKLLKDRFPGLPF